VLGLLFMAGNIAASGMIVGAIF